MKLNRLAERYDAVVILDTETTGLNADSDEIIELAAARFSGGEVVERYDRFLRLSPGRRLTSFITGLTGITEQDLRTEGIEKAEACRDLAAMLGGHVLLAAYNAQFDLCFLRTFLQRDGDPRLLEKTDFLDVMTVYKDRRPFPHKLKDAIAAYGLDDKAVNSHRAIDDVLATAEVLSAMAAEQDDLERYVNLFGFNPRYGVSGYRFPSVTYRAQHFRHTRPLYELP